jgi:UDP-glucose 4-epimerase
LKADSYKAVVTGGAGFIGSHITAELLKQGYQVTVIDNLSTGKIENLESVIKNPALIFVQGSITDSSLLEKHFSGADYVFHQAAIPSVPRSIENPLATHEVNITGTLNVLTAARDKQVKKVVFASSSSVYGDTPTLPKKEDMLPNPQSPYAVSKLAAEYYCWIFEKVYKLPTVCLRYFNVYGPRQDPDSQYSAVIPKFIKSIQNGKSPTIFGDGLQTRDFTYISDVVAANLLAAQSNQGGIFNIGTGQSITLNQLVALMLRYLERTDINSIYLPERSGDIKHSLADISAAGLFGYEPQYSIERGIKETIDSFGVPPQT